MASSDIVIIGGGVIGLSVAWHLAQAGAGSITVIDHAPAPDGVRPPVDGQASPAAAGMLAPLAEAHEVGPFVRLGLESLRRYPAFVEALQEASGGIDPHLRGPGMLRVALTDEEMARLDAARAWQGNTLPLERLDRDAIRRLEPAINPKVRGGLVSSCEKQVEPRRLIHVLTQACIRIGVTYRDRTTAVGIDSDRTGHVAAIRLRGPSGADQSQSCGTLVIAGGAWSVDIGDWLRVSLPVFPVRGQIAALQPMTRLARHTIYGGSSYILPRVDGRIVIGATEEPGAGFDSAVTAGGLKRVLAGGTRLVAAVADAAFDSAWAGLRPASRDGLPLLGPLAGWGNVHAATGHFRNGILLAPITGEIIAHTILNDTPHPLLTPELRADREIIAE